MKTRILLFALLVFLSSCEKEPQKDVNAEKDEIVQFLKDYASYINKNSIDDFDVYWKNEPDISYIPLERDSALIGFDVVKEYFKKQAEEISVIKYSVWNPSVWVNKTKSEALLVFTSSKNILFKNGFNLNLNPVRNSALLNKFEGKWKLISLHESVRQR